MKSYIDYDTDTAPSAEDVLSRDKLDFKVMDSDRWTKVASFVPRIKQDTSSVVLPNRVGWVTTDDTTIPQLGLQYQLNQHSNHFGTTSTSAAKAHVFVKMHIQFRGLKSPSSSSIMNALAPSASI